MLIRKATSLLSSDEHNGFHIIHFNNYFGGKLLKIDEIEFDEKNSYVITAKLDGKIAIYYFPEDYKNY